MKRFISFIVILYLFVFYFSLQCFASDYYFMWNNTTIEVPYKANINDYIFKPNAILYYSGQELSDANVSIMRDGIGTQYLLSDVNTSIVGEYKVMYKAYEYDNYRPGACDGYSQLISFIVVDSIPPVIKCLVDDIHISYSQTEIEYQSLFNITDNYSIEPIIYYYDNINYGVCGKYFITVTAEDYSHNVSTSSITVIIEDSEKPYITSSLGDDILYFEYGEKINLLPYFEAYDEYDKDITSRIKITEIDYDCFEVQNVIASVYDKSGNCCSLRLKLQIRDLISPEISLKTNAVLFTYPLELDSVNFSDYVLAVKDNYSDLKIENIIINKEEVENKVGVYKVLFSISDTSGNSTTSELKIIVVGTTKPVINVRDVTIDVGETFDFLDYITVTDSSDPDVIDNLKLVSSNLNSSKAGIYYMNFIVNNSSGVYNDCTLKVCVRDSKYDFINRDDMLLLIIVIVPSLLLVISSIIIVKKKKI